MSPWSLTYQQSLFKRYRSDKHFSEFLSTRWRQKSTGIDTERNYVAVTLCRPILTRRQLQFARRRMLRYDTVTWSALPSRFRRWWRDYVPTCIVFASDGRHKLRRWICRTERSTSAVVSCPSRRFHFTGSRSTYQPSCYSNGSDCPHRRRRTDFSDVTPVSRKPYRPTTPHRQAGPR